ncbi:LPS assembly lipoprotein LptE [Aestuariibius sp. 2305UL40-4]|uniref:LPS assembly lipoprotein LptE n=1 Tax=Aestuariibius violaceus TaxID=3234132 RepID=UPI00345EC92C
MLLSYLGACGFQPALAPGAPATTLQSRILIEEPDDRATFLIAQRLEERLGQPTAPDLSLDVSLAIEERPAAFTSDREITRYTLEGDLTYSVTDTTGRTVANGTVRSFTAYSATGTTVATLAAEEDAEDRLAIALADLLVARLIAEIPPEPTIAVSGSASAGLTRR